MNYKLRRHGITLAEIAMSLVVVAVVVAAIAAGFTAVNEKRQLTRFAQNLSVHEAKVMQIVLKNRGGYENMSQLASVKEHGYIIGIANNSSSYDIGINYITGPMCRYVLNEHKWAGNLAYYRYKSGDSFIAIPSDEICNTDERVIMVAVFSK